jgi:hypothetical protein
MYNTLFSFKFLRGVASGLPDPVPSHSCYNRVLDNLTFRLFCCKIFSIAKYFQMKMISRKMIFFFFFSVFGCIPENASKNILQCYAKDREEETRAEACVFKKWFTKKLDVNHFSNFNKGFSSQQKLFSV